MRLSRSTGVFVLLFVTLSVYPAKAQDEVPSVVTDQNRSGDLPFSSVVGSSVEHVLINSGNLVVNIPIAQVKGRNGLNYDFGLRYDGRNLVIAQRSGSVWTFEAHNYVPTSGIWQTNQPTLSYTSYSRTACVSVQGNGTATGNKGYILQDAQGAKHTLAMSYETAECPTGSWTYHNSGPDNTNAGIWGSLGTGIPISKVTDANGTVFGGGNGNTITTPTGETVVVEGGYEDANGNSTNNSPAGNDSLGRPIVTQTNGTNQVVYSVHASDGSTQTYTANYASISIHTAFGFATEFVGTRLALSSVVLPNGRSYSFVYDTYGSLTSLTLPTGATITYTWTNTAPGLAQYRYVTSRTVTVGGVSSEWTFLQTQASPSCPTGFAGCTEVTVTDPVGNQSIYYAEGGETLQANIYQGPATGSRLRQYNVTYTTYGDGSSLPTVVTTTLENGLVNKTVYSYDNLTYTITSCPSDFTCQQSGPVSGPQSTSRGNVLEIDSYDWGPGNPGPLLRKIVKTYLHDSNTAYVAPNIVDKVLTSTIYDGGSGSQIAQTQYEYDNYVAGQNALVSTSSNQAPQHDYTKYSSAFTLRGNVTRLKKWRNTDGALLTTTYTYDDLGNIRAISDPLSRTSTYSYIDSWANSSCPPSSGNGQAYVTQFTNAMSQNIKLAYYPCTGLTQAHKDQNDINASRTGTTYTYDLMNRVLTKILPDGGQTSMTYNDVPPVSSTSSSKITSSLNLVLTTVLDGLARPKQSQLTSDPQGTIFSDTTYDALGRKSTVSNPYRSTSEATYGITTTLYDALSRVTKVIPQDGTASANNITTSYSGNCATVTDQAAKARKTCSDGLGRLTQVVEDPATLKFETDYQYDALDNLSCAAQKGTNSGTFTNCASTPAGWRPRTFAYDSLSRLVCASNPENSSAACPATATGTYTSGTTGYVYDANGNLTSKTSPAPNQTGTSTVNTTYQYDALNRLTQKSYSDGVTLPALFGYDQTLITMGSQQFNITNSIGRMSWNCVLHPGSPPSCAGSMTANSYDPMGRLAELWQENPVNGNNIWVSYGYDLFGDETNRSLNNLNYLATFGGAARMLSFSQTSYTNATNPPNLLTNQHYNALGQLSLATFANGLSESWSYDNRGRLQAAAVGTNCGNGTGTCSGSSVYSFSLGFAPNSNVMTANDSVNGNWTYSYDQLNRLSGASSTSGQSCKGLSWTYDAWGNRTDQTVTNGTCNTFHAMAGTNNRLASPYTYDAAGNVTYDGVHHYTYDPENHIISVDNGATTYTYDALGRRAAKSTSGSVTDFIYDREDHVILTNPATPTMIEMYAAGVHLGTYVLNAAQTATVLYFDHADWLGTERARADLSGNACEKISSLPFGDGQTITGTCGDISPRHFTGKERDSESTLDNFGARYFSSAMGRFTSPDPDGAGSLEQDPQSWNMYAYARNNPLKYTDPDGRSYDVCVDNGHGGRNCVHYKSDADFEFEAAKSGATLQDGNILVNGQVIGSYRHNIDAGVENGGTSEDNILAPVLAGGLIGGFRAGIRGIAEGLFGGGAKAVVEETAVATAEQIVSGGTKQAVRDALESSGLSDAAKAAVKSALRRGAAGDKFTVEKLADGSVKIIREVAGRAGGRAAYEQTIDGASGITKEVVQKAYDATGNLVHVDPKFP
jgi:RHS repeat-associated protein